jgi:hypothetical protein
MAVRAPVQIAAEIESIQTLVRSGRLSQVAGAAAIEQLTRELLAAAEAPSVSSPVAGVAPGAPHRDEGTTGQLPAATGGPAAEARTLASPPQAEASAPHQGKPATRTGEAREQTLRPPGGTTDAAPRRNNDSAATGEPGKLLPGQRFSPMQIGLATFFGCFFAGWLLLVSNAWDDRRPVMVVIRLLAVVLFLPAYFLATVTHGVEFGGGYILVCGLFAVLFSQADRPQRAPKSWWKVAIMVVLGWGAWGFSVRPLLRGMPPAAAYTSPRTPSGEMGGTLGLSEAPRALDAGTGPATAPEEDAATVELPTVAGGVDCLPEYIGACVPSWPPDVDCKDISGPVRVVGRDVHKLDRDRDGWACGGRSR